jgi:alpha-N-arabinofuranosidase
MDINTCGSVTSCEWEAITTDAEQSQIELLEGGYNENGRTFQRITVTGENVRAGIRQKVFVNPGKRYEPYFYVKTNVPGTKIEFSLMDSEGKIVNQMVREDLPSEWTKVNPPDFFNTTNKEMYFALAIAGPGSADFDEASFMPTDNIDGIRREAFDMFREWKMGLLRYPGGWFADREQANFKYGIGPIDKRKSPNIMVDGFNQRMDFGTEEYMKLCRNLDIDPYIVVNLETGTPELARQWVEYCNGSTDTEYGQLRAQNGHPEPYNVKVWEIGNEQWQNPSQMAQKYLMHYEAMKKADPSIFTIVDGYQYGGKEYFDACMNIIREKTDLYGYHPAYPGYPKDDPDADDRDRYYHYVAHPDDFSWHIWKTKEYLDELGYPHIKQGSTEWWTDYGQYSDFDWLIDTNYRNSSLESAINTASVLISTLSHPYTFIMNVKTIGIGTFRREFTSDGEKILYGTSNYQVTQMFSNHYGFKTLPTFVDSPTYKPEPIEGWWPVQVAPYVKGIATASRDTVFLAVLNRHLDSELELEIEWNFEPASNECKIYSFTSNHFLDHNGPDNPLNIVPFEENWNFGNNITLPSKSVSIIAVPAKLPSSIAMEPDKFSFRVYPNPAVDFVRIFSNYLGDFDIRISDLNGRVIHEENFRGDNGRKIETGSIAPGAYLVELIGDKIRKSEILIITK